MSVKIKVEVLLCPHQRYLRSAPPGASWPRPAKLPVQLTRTGGGPADAVSLGKTNAKGVTKLSGELERDTYKVEIPGYDFEADDLDLAKATDGQTLPVRLAPCAGRSLVVLQFTEYPADAGLGGANMRITSPGGFSAPSTSTPDGRVYATAPADPVTFDFDPVPVAGGGRIIPADRTVPYTVEESDIVQVIPVAYWPAIEISVEPTVNTPSGSAALTDARVTVEYRGSPGVPGSSATQSLPRGGTTVSFEYTFPGVYVVTVTPPADFAGWPIKAVPSVTTAALPSGRSLPVPVQFDVVATQSAEFRVQTPQNQPLKRDLRLQIIGPASTVQPVIGKGPAFTADVPANESLKVKLDPAAAPVITVPRIGDVPLTMPAQEQPVVAPPGENAIVLDYLYSITAQVVDEHGREVAGAMIDVVDDQQNPVGTAITDEHGGFVLGLKTGGTYYLAQHPQGGEVGIQERVDVHSNGRALVRVQRGGRGGGTGPDGSSQVREAFTDLAAYPVLTEGVSTTGGPGPAPSGLGTAGADYGQVVDQAMRDVLGWRPSTDVSGFQAALTGAFQLREVEGHTEWTWQQRGYAVQADMGALTGAQASIYARAKSALDQILPLLSGLTTLNPALCPPQDLEAIRTVITVELQELVTELALPGGPRIQRVDQLFHLLTGHGVGSRNLNPDLVQGNLGTLRDRFGLTVDEIDTVDEERIVTNFRIVVEQVLTLQASWSTDRGLLAPLDPRASFGTVLIWLSRSLEAVCESVSDLTFALDSVFVDAAQRQVIELKFPDQEALLLSDLLDWVERASRDEGPRIIQDAGKDGVFAFAPVLRQLRDLVRATRNAARHGGGLPDGMRTPRVDRALQVLITQLSEATDLAGTVRRDPPPLIEAALVFEGGTGTRVSLAQLSRSVPSIHVDIFGANFRPNASAVLIAQDREDLPELHTGSITVTPPNLITTTFRNPTTVRDGAGVTWLVAVTNEDGTQSKQFPI
jgi:hypothetical protein